MEAIAYRKDSRIELQHQSTSQEKHIATRYFINLLGVPEDQGTGDFTFACVIHTNLHIIPLKLEAIIMRHYTIDLSLLYLKI